MSDDDGEELAMLRAQRAERLGGNAGLVRRYPIADPIGLAHALQHDAFRVSSELSRSERRRLPLPPPSTMRAHGEWIATHGRMERHSASRLTITLHV